jgi:hypothetical protein
MSLALQGQIIEADPRLSVSKLFRDFYALEVTKLQLEVSSRWLIECYDGDHNEERAGASPSS